MVITGVNVILPIVIQDVTTLHAATVRMCNLLQRITIVYGLYYMQDLVYFVTLLVVMIQTHSV